MREWFYFRNPFLTAIRDQYKKGLHISTFTDSRLQAKGEDEFYGPLYTKYHPYHLNFLTAYNAWKSQGGVQKGATLSRDQLLKLLSPGKINAWEAAVMTVYAKGSPDYKIIFPQGHKPYQTGDSDQRVNAVAQLINALTGRAPLATTLTDVTTFYDQLLAAATAQQGQMGNTGTLSDQVLGTMIEALTTMFSILGTCIETFPNDPSVCASIFDLETIRNHEQLIYTVTLEAEENHNILEHTFVSTDQMKGSNSGTTVLHLYAAPNAHAPVNGSPVIIFNPQEEKTIDATMLGDLSNRFLHIINTSTNAEGHFKLTLE